MAAFVDIFRQYPEMAIFLALGAVHSGVDDPMTLAAAIGSAF